MSEEIKLVKQVNIFSDGSETVLVFDPSKEVLLSESELTAEVPAEEAEAPSVEEEAVEEEVEQTPAESIEDEA